MKTKTILTTLLLTFMGLSTAFSQVGIGTSQPDASAILDVVSNPTAPATHQGFLPPRMTQTERDQINNPAAGLMVYNNSNNRPNYYNGTEWMNFDGTSAATAVGNSYQGGIIAYILQPGDPGYDTNVTHGLIAAPSDQSADIQWYNGTYTTTGATGTALGTGQANTTAIVTNQGAGSYAAQLCNDLVLGGYSDWYLPSKDELNKLYENKVAVGGFASDYYYWSSSEFSSDYAWAQGFADGYQYGFDKLIQIRVRAVRAF